MASGVNYGNHQVLGDYPCDIRSIKRYRGGFNLNYDDLKTKYEGATLPPFFPLYVNLTTREAFTTAQTDDDSNVVVQAFLYNTVLVEEGATVTVIFSADEISFSGLEKQNVVAKDGTTKAVFETFTKATRDEFIKTYPHCTFVA